jgi:hypothetical protein
MFRRNLALVHMVAISALAVARVPALAQDDEMPIKLTLYPSAEPRPAVKYRLLPELMDQIPGNAAVHYGKVTAERIRLFGNSELIEQIDSLQEAPFDVVRRNDLRPGLRLPLQGVEDELRRAARCTGCDWQLEVRDGPGYGLLLPEVSQTRQFGPILAVNARFRVATGQFDEAVETLQTGYALARNIAKGETIVNGLVGIAICRLLNRQVVDFIQQPTSPNLYWALTMLPRPMIDIREGVEFEYHGVEQTFPELRGLETAEYSPEQWRGLLHDFAGRYHSLTQRSDSKPPATAEELDAACQRGFAAAKRALVARGLPPGQVDQMTVHQVALISTLQSRHELLADAIKYFTLRYPQAVQGIDRALEDAERARTEGREVVPLSANILPAIRSARTAIVRNDQQFASLRVIEALRIYAAAHDGRLPDNLNDMTDVPIPLDPVKEQPFEYSRLGDTAELTGAALPSSRDFWSPPTGSGPPLKYDITIGRP